MKGIIYKWTCLITGKSYIGQTINEKKREKEFLDKNDSYTTIGSKIYNARKKYGLSEGVWEKEVLKRLWCKDGKEDELFERLNYWEKYYIKKFGTFNDGYNSTDGGNNFIVSDETKEKCKQAAEKWWANASEHEKTKCNYWSGKLRNASTNISNREKHIGVKKSSMTKDKISKSVLSKVNRKKIKQFDLNGNLLKEYSSISIIKKDTNFNTSGIVRCAKGLQKKSHGYIWRFSDENDIISTEKGRGYYFHQRLKKFKARIRVNGKEYNLGFFKTEKAASIIYKLALDNKNNIEGWFKNIEDIKQDIIKKWDS